MLIVTTEGAGWICLDHRPTEMDPSLPSIKKKVDKIRIFGTNPFGFGDEPLSTHMLIHLANL